MNVSKKGLDKNIAKYYTAVLWIRIRWIRKILASWIRIRKNMRIHDPDPRGKINQKLQMKNWTLLAPFFSL